MLQKNFQLQNGNNMETKLYCVCYYTNYGLNTMIIEATDMIVARDLAEENGAWALSSIEEIVKTGGNQILIQE